MFSHIINLGVQDVLNWLNIKANEDYDHLDDQSGNDDDASSFSLSLYYSERKYRYP